MILIKKEQFLINGNYVIISSQINFENIKVGAKLFYIIIIILITIIITVIIIIIIIINTDYCYCYYYYYYYYYFSH